MDVHGAPGRWIRQRHRLRELLRAILTRVGRHEPGAKADILLLGSGRSGSTWLMEVIAAEPGMRFVNEPFIPRKWRRLGLPSGVLDGKDRLLEIPAGCEPHFKAYLEDPLATRSDGPYDLLSDDFHFRTNRRVLKLLSAPIAEEIDALGLGYHAVYFMRHPIPTALSMMKSARTSLRVPGGHLADASFVRNHLGPDLEARSRQFLEAGSDLQRWVLDWCLTNLRPLRAIRAGAVDHWLVLTYEELLLAPESTVNLLARRLDLRAPERLLARIQTPSASTDPGRVSALRASDARTRVLGWRSKVGAEDERGTFDVLDALGLDPYEYGRPVARRPYLHSPAAVEAAVS